MSVHELASQLGVQWVNMSVSSMVLSKAYKMEDMKESSLDRYLEKVMDLSLVSLKVSWLDIEKVDVWE
jgi:hypothetical protein